MAERPVHQVAPVVQVAPTQTVKVATINPVVNVTQDTVGPSNVTAAVSHSAAGVTAEVSNNVPAALNQSPQFNINISLNTAGPPTGADPSHDHGTHAVHPGQKHPLGGSYFKYPVPFRHQRQCTSCLKHKPPVIDLDKGTKDSPIALDDSDEDDQSGKACTEGHTPTPCGHAPTSSPPKAQSTAPHIESPATEQVQQVTAAPALYKEALSVKSEGSDDSAKRRKLGPQYSNQTLYYAALKGDASKVLFVRGRNRMGPLRDIPMWNLLAPRRVSLLLEGNPDKMNFRVKDTGMTPVHAAVKSGNVDVLKELTRHMGAGTLTLEAMDKELQTPLFYAVKQNKVPCVRFLLQQGVNLNARDGNARTALHYACELGNMECINLILNDGRAKVNTQDTDGWTALMWACEYRYQEVVKQLLQKGADTYLRDREQNLALHWASFSGNGAIVKLILATKCDLDAVNERGDTALHIAARLSHKECVTTLVNSGASVRLPNKTGKLCIDDAPPDIIALISKLEKERDSRNFVSNTRQPRNTVLHSDISCGKEKIPLPCINEVDDVPAPLDFVYVKESFESSYLCINRNMNTIKSCVCENQCRPGNPCSCFFLTTGNKCIYNKDGKLNTEISEQFSDLVIFECNQRCRCWAHCRNRVIQKGLSNPIQLFRTNGKGWGVRSSKVLSKGTFICEYIGEIISDSDADRRLNDTYLFDLTVVSINSSKKENKTIGSIDACHYGNISRFINSSCEPNCVPVKVFVDHQDLRFPRIAFFTTKDVEPYEELTFYYGDSFWDVKKEVLKCCCGAPNCISLMSREDIESDNSSDVEIVE